MFVRVTGIAALASETCVPVNEQVSGIPMQPDNVSSGISTNVPAADIVPGGVGVTTTGVALVTIPAVTLKVGEFGGGKTVTGEGKPATVGLLLSPTMIPPAGGVPVSVNVPVVICPEATFIGLKDSEVTTGGITVRPPPEAPLGSVAVTVTAVLLDTANVFVTLNVPLDAPGAMAKFIGTVTTPALLLIRLAVSPPTDAVAAQAGGASPFKLTLPTGLGLVPPVTEFGVNVNVEMTAGLTVNVLLALLLPSVVITVTLVDAATPTVVSVNGCEVVFPARTITLMADNVTGSQPEITLTPNDTVIPPAGADELMVTVPVG